MISRLSRARPTSTLFTSCWSMVQLLLRTILMSVRSQFRINSRGGFLPCPQCLPHFPKFSLHTIKVCDGILALCCGRLSLDKVHPMQQCVCPVSVLSSTCPLNSTNMDLSQVKTIPQQQPLQSVLIRLLLVLQIQLHLPILSITQQNSSSSLLGW